MLCNSKTEILFYSEQLFGIRLEAGIIFGGDFERFARFSAKNLIEIALMG